MRHSDTHWGLCQSEEDECIWTHSKGKKGNINNKALYINASTIFFKELYTQGGKTIWKESEAKMFKDCKKV